MKIDLTALTLTLHRGSLDCYVLCLDAVYPRTSLLDYDELGIEYRNSNILSFRFPLTPAVRTRVLINFYRDLLCCFRYQNARVEAMAVAESDTGWLTSQSSSHIQLQY